MLEFTYSWHVEPDSQTFKQMRQMRMFVQVLRNKLEKEFPQHPAVFFPDVKDRTLRANALVRSYDAPKMYNWFQQNGRISGACVNRTAQGKAGARYRRRQPRVYLLKL
jgi:hypothetical protein